MRRQATRSHGFPAIQPSARQRPARVLVASSLAVLVAVAGTVMGLMVAGQSAKGTSATGSNPLPSTAAAFNAGLNGVVNASTHRGGTLTFDASSVPDSFDPGNTYFPWVEDFDRLFAMPMFTYKSCPGRCGLQLVPDLATDMGTTSGNGLAWIFRAPSRAGGDTVT
jgi:peptide/nickel transport system substrate-binding protein